LRQRKQAASGRKLAFVDDYPSVVQRINRRKNRFYQVGRNTAVNQDPAFNIG
jgi:hypothetical protein